jgi:Ger(x)C family germination protein
VANQTNGSERKAYFQVKNCRLLTFLLCAILFLLPGCWDGAELQKRAVVLMIGIDPSDQDNHNVKVSLQLARPQKFSATPRASTGSEEENTVVVSKSGVDVADAIRKIQLSVDRDLFFGHVRGLVINQHMAGSGILPLMNPLLQSRMASRETWLFVSKNPASEVLKYSPALDAIPSTYLSNFFENRLLLTQPYEATVGGFHQRLVTPGIQPIAVWLGSGDGALSAPRIEGFAAFSADKFVGGLNQQQAVGWMFVENQFPKSSLTFKCPTKQGGQFVVDIKSVKSRSRVIHAGANEPRTVITVRVKGWIEGGACVTNTDQQELAMLNQQVKSEVEKLVKTTVLQCQNFDADILGMGRNVYQFSPHDWQGDNQWDRKFPKIITTMQVQVQLDFLQTYKKFDFNPEA